MTTPYEESIYSIIATFFVSNYYNAVYFAAKDHAMLNGTSVTKTYTTFVHQFIRSLQGNVESYRHVAKSLCSYYEEHSHQTLVAYSDFEGKILEIFVPKEQLKFFNMHQRERNMLYIVTEIAKSIGLCIVQPGQLRGVIDDRTNEDYIERLKTYGQASLRLMREEMHAKYVEVSVNGKSGATMQREQVQRAHKLFEKIAKEKCVIAEENTKLKADLAKALNYIRALKSAYETTARELKTAQARPESKPQPARASSPPLPIRAPSPPAVRAPSPQLANNDDFEITDTKAPVVEDSWSSDIWTNTFDLGDDQ